MTPPIFTAREADVITSAFLLANRYVVSDIETNCVRCGEWLDTRAAVDPREHSPECIDMMVEALRYAEKVGLVERHPQHRYLVRLTREVLA